MTTLAMDDYCGCCGRLVGKGERIRPSLRISWCRQCAAHVLLGGAYEHRTFEAQHRKPCPFRQEAQ